ncbi:SpoVR family protein [Deferrisoma palaeochoriense]
MRSVRTDPLLSRLVDRVMEIARDLGRTVPEIRFFLLDGLEFAALLEKNVYPASPLNLWEGKRMVHRRHRIETGQETTLYYEVVQPGDPAYAYLNSANSPVIQASVMAHVVGHCEFSLLNVLRDAEPDRTERVLHLVRKVELARQQMGHKDYVEFWNACESATSLAAPKSQYNLENTVESESRPSARLRREDAAPKPRPILPVFTTLTELLQPAEEAPFEREVREKRRQQALGRRGYVLRAPCQDVLGFLRLYAPLSPAERRVLEYLYFTRAPQEFVIRTQIMNEGWAMYWEKKIMMELFRERVIPGVIEYAKVFSGVCAPRPYFQRNPYHLGYNLWCRIEDDLRAGRLTLEYLEEKDLLKRETWRRDTGVDPIEAMGRIVRTTTDAEFLRRYLTKEAVEDLHLNRLPRPLAERMGIRPADAYRMDERWVWLDPEEVRKEMLRFYVHFYRPRIYVVDTEFRDGGLLLYHRDDGRALRQDWIRPTLRNLNRIWKGPVALVTRSTLHAYAGGRYAQEEVEPVEFDEVRHRMLRGEKALAA